MKKWFYLIFFSVILIGCSKKPTNQLAPYTLEEFNLILDSAGVSLDKEPTHAINFSDYSPGVNRINSKPVIYERLDFYVIEFENETQAKNEALRLNQYYSRNWLFDKVDGEPILEDLIIVKFHAQNPKRRVQRKPVNIPKNAGEHHGESTSGGH